MVLIMGWGGGVTQDLGEVVPIVCPKCHNRVYLHHIRSDKRISLYFVPIFPYENNAYLACPICRFGVMLNKDQGGAVERMRSSTAQFRRGVIAEPAYRVAVERFLGQVGLDGAGTQVLQPAPTIPPPITARPVAPAAAPASPSLPDQLASIARLHADGLLTDDEFATAKRRLLGS